MENIIAAVILVVIVGLAGFYIWKEKKSGRKCIGCPMSGCASCKGCSDNTPENIKTFDSNL